MVIGESVHCLKDPGLLTSLDYENAIQFKKKYNPQF